MFLGEEADDLGAGIDVGFEGWDMLCSKRELGGKVDLGCIGVFAYLTKRIVRDSCIEDNAG